MRPSLEYGQGLVFGEAVSWAMLIILSGHFGSSGIALFLDKFVFGDKM